MNYFGSKLNTNDLSSLLQFFLYKRY